MLQPVAPGIFAWETKDKARFRAFAVQDAEGVVLIDPVTPDAEEARALEALGPVRAVLITGPHHERAAQALADRAGAPVYAHPDAIAQFEATRAQPFPGALPLGLEVWDDAGSFKGQVSIYVPRDGGTLIAGDTWHNIDMKAMPLPVRLFLRHVVKLRDGLHLTPPSKCSDAQALVAGAKRHLQRPVERLLVSHGEHVTSGAGPRLLARLEQGP